MFFACRPDILLIILFYCTCAVDLFNFPATAIVFFLYFPECICPLLGFSTNSLCYLPVVLLANFCCQIALAFLCILFLLNYITHSQRGLLGKSFCHCHFSVLLQWHYYYFFFFHLKQLKPSRSGISSQLFVQFSFNVWKIFLLLCCCCRRCLPFVNVQVLVVCGLLCWPSKPRP